MKKSLSVYLAWFFMVSITTRLNGFSAIAEVNDLGNQFVDRLSKEAFAEAIAQFDATMLQALPEPKLRQTWKSLQQQAGQFKRRLRTRSFKVGAYDMVLVSCEFERAKIDVKVALNAKGEVGGLFFLPGADEPETTAVAPYVRTNAFHEQAFTVGSGDWRLPGTLSVPIPSPSEGSPAVVLVHGSGPNDRDQTVAALKPFRDLAWGLATRGISVLRYEKRTKEYSTRYASKKLTITPQEETIDDALTAVKQLRGTKGIDPKRVFVLGSSLGGTLAPRIGHADPAIAGLIILAGATRPLEDLMVEQTQYLMSLNGQPSKTEQEQLRSVESAAARIKKLTPADESSSNILLGAPATYWLDLRAHDPVKEAKTLHQPLLILQGDRDYQVTQADFERWKQGLAGSSAVTLKLFPGLNHLFVSGEGKPNPQEYEKPGHVAAIVVADIANWILAQH
jgi:dienelactone hydrolase